MTKKEKAILTHLAENLDARAKNSRESAERKLNPIDWRANDAGAAWAFAVAADYLRGIRDGHERLPSVAELLKAP